MICRYYDICYVMKWERLCGDMLYGLCDVLCYSYIYMLYRYISQLYALQDPYFTGTMYMFLNEKFPTIILYVYYMFKTFIIVLYINVTSHYLTLIDLSNMD